MATQQDTYATRRPSYGLFRLRLRLRLRSGWWASLLRHSFASTPSDHLSPTMCGPLPRRDILQDHHIIRVFGTAEHSPIRNAGGEAALLVFIVTRAPCGVVLDLVVDSQRSE